MALAAAALPAVASAASWAPVHIATSAGQSVGPAVAASTDGRFAVGFVRRLDDVNRAEVRTGRLTDRLRGGSVLLDSSTGNVDSVAVTLTGDDGALGAAWRTLGEPRAAAPRRDRRRRGEISGPFNLTTEGTESAYSPRWVSQPSGPPLLVWDRRTTSAQAPLDGDRFGPAGVVPGTGVAAQPSLAVQADGSQLAVWVQGGRVFAANAPAAGQPFGAPVALSGAGIARDPQLVTQPDGTAVVAWVRNGGSGNVMEVVTRPPGGSFQAPIALSAPTEGAFAPRLATTGAGGFVAAWVAGPTTRGWGSAGGPLRAMQLFASGAPTQRTLTLTPAGVKVVDPSVASDGRTGVMVGWRAGSGDARQIVARRIAANGTVGSTRTLDAGSRIEAGSPVMTGSLGTVAVAWTAGGVIRYRLYR